MPEPTEHIASELLYQTGGLNISTVLELLGNRFPGQVCFSTSFSYEDQVITHHLVETGLPARIFTLDTGRLFPETYSVWSSTLAMYKINVHPYYPHQQLLQDFIAEKGPNSFYETVDNRKQCCYIRKVEPLQRALKGMAVWITGLRAEHSSGRSDLPEIEWDAVNSVIKYHPLLHWSTEQVKQYIAEHHIPYNPLHDRGFVSIGCAPCTRAIRPGEDFRAGRWWWEDANGKECGLHVHPSGGNH